jgi:hypothetical protein
MRIATKAETAKNTRAVASQRSVRRTSPGSIGAAVLLKKRFWEYMRNRFASRKARYRTHEQVVSHIIDNKDK